MFQAIFQREDNHTGRSKGFGFVTYVSECGMRLDSRLFFARESAEACLAERGHSLDGKWVDVKRYDHSNPPGGWRD